MAALAYSPPSPEQRLRALKTFYQTLPRSKVLQEALGSSKTLLPGTPTDAVPLIEHTIVVCVDTESYTMNTDQMTELGLAYISRKTAKSVGLLGSHGWRLQKALKFLHFRVAEHAHLMSNRLDSKGPLGNRFGTTTFASFAELRAILNDLFNLYIETDDPALKGCKHPIVLVGHALRHDTENTNKQGLGYNLDDNLTLVAKVDTQSLARETKVWVPPVGMESNEIGLRVLIENIGFKHLNDHTACNDAARTMMCAVHMVLPNPLRTSSDPKITMQAVADRVEAQSKASSGAPYGTLLCCIRCAGRDHSIAECQAADIRCAACNRFDLSATREANITSHIETYCPRVAKFKAWLRRYLDALRKNRQPTAEVAAGPSSDSYPWSTWPPHIQWPLEALREAKCAAELIRHNPQWQEPAPFVYNMEAALGGIPVPSTGTWVPLAATPSAPATNRAAPGTKREITQSKSRARSGTQGSLGRVQSGNGRGCAITGGTGYNTGADGDPWDPAAVW